ncbi:MAG: (d)CMP kinase [Candidatus Velthaea sp.]|jgi:cytidylate kinase
MSNRHVAIDGPVASGKTVTARALARQLGTLYLDTGAMYRAAAYLTLREGIDLDNEDAIVALLGRHAVRLVVEDGSESGYRVEIDGTDMALRLFDPDVASVVSSVAAFGRVRERMVAAQREIAREGPVVMAGRDIGTVVLPEARFKFFLTASVDERAKRRHLEFGQRGVILPFEEVREQIAERDRIDMTRAVAPLRAAADAVVIDSTGLRSDEVVARMRAFVEAP